MFQSTALMLTATLKWICLLVIQKSLSIHVLFKEDCFRSYMAKAAQRPPENSCLTVKVPLWKSSSTCNINSDFFFCSWKWKRQQGIHLNVMNTKSCSDCVWAILTLACNSKSVQKQAAAHMELLSWILFGRSSSGRGICMWVWLVFQIAKLRNSRLKPFAQDHRGTEPMSCSFTVCSFNHIWFPEGWKCVSTDLLQHPYGSSSLFRRF